MNLIHCNEDQRNNVHQILLFKLSSPFNWMMYCFEKRDCEIQSIWTLGSHVRINRLNQIQTIKLNMLFLLPLSLSYYPVLTLRLLPRMTPLLILLSQRYT